MIKGTVFRASNGKALAYGYEESPHIQKLTSQGHPFITGARKVNDLGQPLKYDFSLNTTVVDQEQIDEELADKQADEQRRQNAIQAYQNLNAAIGSTDWTNPNNIDQAFTGILTMVRYLASQLDA